jgi:hypothetical protein
MVTIAAKMDSANQPGATAMGTEAVVTRTVVAIMYLAVEALMDRTVWTDSYGRWI